MLTEEQEKKRAIEISQLYGTPLKRRAQLEIQRNNIKWSTTLIVAFVLTLPFAAANALFGFYQKSSYASLTDIQSASIGFIVMLFLLAGLFIFCLKFSADELYRTYSTSRFIFYVTLFLFIPSCYYLSSITGGAPGQNAQELITRSLVFAGLAVIASTVIIAVLTIIASRASRKTSDTI